MNIQLLLVDAQNDFAANGINSNGYNGTLYVTGADKDMENVSNLINRLGSKISKIHATMDSHHVMQVFHPSFWIDKNGNNPRPFTIISVKDIENGIWQTTVNELKQQTLAYVRKLEAQGNYPLCIWPEHCLISGIGWCLVPCVHNAIVNWERVNKRETNYYLKGSFYLSEHYGALAAEVIFPEEPSTMINTSLIRSLQEADILLVAGEALSHCVKASIEQVAQAFGDDNIKKIILLSDCCSSVSGFESVGFDFTKKMAKRGMRISKSTEILKY
jgi:nicotinamidase-related amidase